ncbi:MAG TPA: hypothetical protein H9740_09295, partial [Candidatus Hungatella pullicola]|nr:hypothetical protein [Candidatus Hungatella pullicola]
MKDLIENKAETVPGRRNGLCFCFIGNSDFWIRGKEALLIEHMLNQQGNGHDNRTMVRFRRYKNLL